MSLFRFDESGLVRPDRLSWVMAALIVLVIVNVVAYSNRYLRGDRNRRWHLGCVLLLAVSALAMVLADHLLLLLTGWAASNCLLVRLMIHNARWSAARNSGWLALKTLGLGSLILGAGFWLLAESAQSASIARILELSGDSAPMHFDGLSLIALAAMVQSAAWPFHRWLLSSLNSPTPVSALMHAGIVNGGGFLLVRFAPLYAREPEMLHGLFVIGLITALVGTFWKLLQTDIKRMLACSTMGQMGCMLVQCGMGLFAPAISHLCWHGLFKAYLFLSAGSVVQESRRGPAAAAPSPFRFCLACCAGMCGALVFAWSSGTGIDVADTGCLMLALAFMAATQLAIGLLDKPLTILRAVSACLVGVGAGGLYGLSIRLVEAGLGSSLAMPPQPMDAMYFAGVASIFLMWMAMVLDLPGRLQARPSWKRLYMAGLNASGPHPQTVTATRTTYQY